MATRVGAFFEVEPTMSTVRRVPGHLDLPIKTAHVSRAIVSLKQARFHILFVPDVLAGLQHQRGQFRCIGVREAGVDVENRLDRSFNFETHYIRGFARTKTRVGLALAVMMAAPARSRGMSNSLSPAQPTSGRLARSR